MTSSSSTFASGQSPTAAQVNGWAQGTLGYAQVTANQGSITTVVDLTGLTVTVTLVAGRRIKITGQVPIQSTVADDTFAILIQEGAAPVGGGSGVLRPANSAITGHYAATLTPSAGSHTYKLTAQRLAGTGTLSTNVSASIPAYILVEDIGAV